MNGKRTMSYLSDPKEKLITLSTWLKKRNCIPQKIAWVSLREYILSIPVMLISPWQYSAEMGNSWLCKKHPSRSFQEKETIAHLFLLSQYVRFIASGWGYLLSFVFNKLQFTPNCRMVRVGNYLWRSSSESLCFSRIMSRHNFNIREGDSTTSLAPCSSALSPSSKEAFPHTQIPSWQPQFHPLPLE